MVMTAKLSPCGTYRYSLSRIWDKSKSLVLFVMLNPSTADGTQDDPTIRRCIAYAKAWGYGGIVVVNLFALRSVDPALIKMHRDPIGPQNDKFIRYWATKCELVIAAWGCKGSFNGRDEDVMRMLGVCGYPVHALRISSRGKPWHPLYLPKDLKPCSWR